MFNLSWMLGHSKTTYTSHKTPTTLKTKSGSKTTLNEIAASSIPPCRLNPFLFNGHLQTMYTAVKDPGPPIYYKRQIFDSDHSVYPGTFAVDFVVRPSGEEPHGKGEPEKDDELPERTTNFSSAEWESISSTDTKPMLVALHGLTGGSHEVYLRETLYPLITSGWEACVVNGRGCALSKVTTPQLFNARATWDVRQLLETLTQLFPNRPLYGVGFSLGANILTNYCGESGVNCPLRAAVSCSNPWNLEVCNTELQRTVLGLHVYSRTMGRNLMGLFQRHRAQITQNPGIDVEALLKSKFLHEFDRQVQCPTWGYPTEGAYYRDSQSVDALLAIRIPFLGINAEDDPISNKAGLPYQEVIQNPHALLCTTDWGGHLGSFQLGGGRWFAVATAEFLKKMHDEVDFGASGDAGGAEEGVNMGGLQGQKYPIFDPNHRRLILPEA
ncbi:medium-chain fatty acid ethyl ester synthase/esteras-like protein 1 [Stemphylium lycopersici]|uniref:alcohol O-acetyltransferase n=1 Tax=Stemphylium lycopersici TaxID=183478 RepID=A0A364N447_STELY|nr:alpha beta fold family protein [Stemphylium lycopersici]RAR02463.1 medium-chain fatty acid ethyl ester synthase/esteras-like protein 1 [Stemphylium lycopersici]RAR11460.1 medium-chain fatty acid ethyl ester synthase/esteras-like protein 1 [Stemphylium lycopersici]